MFLASLFSEKAIINILVDNYTITQFQQQVLGEDRYLTHLLHQVLPSNSIGFCSQSRLKTDPPSSSWDFVRQRRRWLLGSIANEGYMISSPILWKKYPILMLYKVIQTSWRSTTFSQLIVFLFGNLIYIF